jgi:hypothetical protein
MTHGDDARLADLLAPRAFEVLPRRGWGSMLGQPADG